MSEIELTEGAKQILLRMAARVRAIRESEARAQRTTTKEPLSERQLVEFDESLVSDSGETENDNSSS